MTLLRNFVFGFLFVSVSLSAAVPAAHLDQLELQKQYDVFDTRYPETKASLNADERALLLKTVNENPVAKLSALTTFDPPPGGIGFCFGRAMAAHFSARQMGLERKSILKLFAAGNMQDNGERWRFHVTTIVLGDDGKWYTIDPVMVAEGFKDPLLPKQWIKNVEDIFVAKAQFPNNLARYYIADPDAIMVDMREVPATKEQETGNRIIELTFNPERPGMELERDVADLGDFKVYRVDNDAVQKYFLARHNGKVENEFNFLKLDITIFFPTMKEPRSYFYNHYFEKLFETYAQP